MGFRAEVKAKYLWPGPVGDVVLEPSPRPRPGTLQSLQDILSFLASTRDTQITTLLEFLGDPRRHPLERAKKERLRLKKEIEVGVITRTPTQEAETKVELLDIQIKATLDELANSLSGVICVELPGWGILNLWDPAKGMKHPRGDWAFSGAEGIIVALEVASQLHVPLDYVVLPDRQYDERTLQAIDSWGVRNKAMVFVSLTYTQPHGLQVPVANIWGGSHAD